MPSQILGYYSSQTGALLKDFDRTAAGVNDWLIARYGLEFARTLQKDVREEYVKLIPEIPYIKGMRARMLNNFLLITVQEVATYKTMNRHGKPPAEAWELCHQALRCRLEKIPRWKRWLLGQLMFSNLLRKVMARRARQQKKISLGDFEVEYLVGEEDDIDLGVNYVQCGNHLFAMKHGAEAFAPYICMPDIALSDAMEWGLIRAQTLADGCKYCDFRFKKGAATQISSKTLEVQNAIERIRDREAKQSAAAAAGKRRGRA